MENAFIPLNTSLVFSDKMDVSIIVGRSVLWSIFLQARR